MTNDLRDDRLARLLEAAASRIDVTPHIQPVLQRGSLRRGVRTTAMVAAVAVFVGAVGYGALRTHDASAPGIDPSTWNEYPSPDGWTARYPDGWIVQPFAGPVAKIYLSGAFFSSVAYDFHHPDLGPKDVTSAWDLSEFPRDGVAVGFERFVGGPPGMRSGPDTPFPLSLADVPAVQSSSTPESGGQRTIDIVHDGSRYTLNVWFGPEATQEDHEIARLLVTTIAFPGTRVEPRPTTTSEDTITPVPVEYATPFFPYREGWHTRDFGNVERGSAAAAWASTVPFEPGDRVDTPPAIPPDTIAALPSDGVVVTVLVTPWSHDPGLGPYPPAADRPLDLGQATLRGPTAEEPPGDYSILEIQPGYLLVRVYFGVTDPSPDLVAIAQKELDAVEIPPVCPTPATGGFEATPSATEGDPGETVTIDGPMPFQHEDGSYLHDGDTFMSAWWNASPDDWESLSSFSTATPSPATAGPLLRLGESGRGACSFSIAFTVPDVPPGSYPIVVIQESPNSSTLEATLTFTVR